MIAFELFEFFRDHGYTLKAKDETGKSVKIRPDDSDFEKILDDAAGRLYNEPIGARLNVGKLIIEKREHDFEVYVLVGTYN